MTLDVSSTLVESVPCMWGRATLVMLVSRICMIVTSMTEPVMAHLRAAGSAIAGWTGSGTRVRQAECYAPKNSTNFFLISSLRFSSSSASTVRSFSSWSLGLSEGYFTSGWPV